MPGILFRYTLIEMLRVVGLTAAVLVTVIAFGATIKPLANDALLDAVQTLKYLGLAIVPMLQFALPFAAGFGATLSLHRLTTDNEIIAMAACGVSYRRIVAPVLALGIILTLVMVVLTQWIIPQFFELLEQTVAKDIPKIFEASIRRGEPFQAKRLQIYADGILAEHPTDPAGPESRLILSKVAVAELDEDGRLVTDISAARAVVDVYRRDGDSYLKFVMTDTVAYKSNTGELAHAPMWTPEKALLIPSDVTENVKAMSQGRMIELYRDPDGFGGVIEAKQGLAEAIRDAEARGAIDAALRSAGEIELFERADPGAAGTRSYAVHADHLSNKDGAFTRRNGEEIEVIQRENQAATRRFTSSDVRLVPAEDASNGYAAFDMVLGPTRVFDLRASGGGNQRDRLTLPGLTLSGVTTDELAKLSSGELLARAEGARGGAERVGAKISRLRHKVDTFRQEIVSRMLSRYSLSITACLLLMLGALLAMRLRGSQPLTIYMLAFLPAILTLIMIAAGEQFLRDGRLLGGVVMWSGNGLIAAMCAATYVQIGRH